MEYERKTYFVEQEYDDVKGFTVLNAEDGTYHITEKWLKPESEDKWLDYLIPESDLLERVEAGHCEKKGKLTDNQFTKLCELVEWYTDESAEQEAEA